MIDAILTEAFMKETSEQRLGFCIVKNDWDGTGYTGHLDHTFGSSICISVDTMDSYLLVVKAMIVASWSSPSSPLRMTTQEKIACWKEYSCVLTNGTYFRFFAIDTDSE
jgi:hypothetical protein